LQRRRTTSLPPSCMAAGSHTLIKKMANGARPFAGIAANAG
jgi:hypothetical protein